MADVLISGVISHAPGRNPPGEKYSLFVNNFSGNDAQDGGTYKVVGTVKEKNVPSNIPVFRKVRLFCAVSGRLVRETWSDKTTGEYSFLNMRYGPWFVVSHDHTKNFNAAIADSVVGEPM